MRILKILFLTGLLPLSTFAQDLISPMTPDNGDTLETVNPLISWFIPGGNPGNNPREYYRLIVVELKKEQSPEAGVVVNTPLLKMDKVAGMQVFYPYDAPELKAGKRYGWQVQKLINNVLADKSEAWEFIIALPEIPAYNKYATLRKHHDGSTYQATGGKIFFQMDEAYYSESLELIIYDDHRKMVNKQVLDDKQSGTNAGSVNVKSNGANFYELDMGSLAKPGNYELVVFDAKHQQYVLKFRIL